MPIKHKQKRLRGRPRGSKLHVDGLCEVCGWRKAQQVHHWHYRNLTRERPEDLCAVCTWCHHDLHCLVPDAANDNEIQLLIFRVPKNLKRKIKRSSRLANHSVSKEVRLALDAWIALPEEQRSAWIEENSDRSLGGSVAQEARWALEYWVKVAGEET